MQPPTKSTERWQGKPQYHAEETLEDKIDLWFKVFLKQVNFPTNWLTKALFATTLISAAPYFILFFVPVEKNTEETKPLLNVSLNTKIKAYSEVAHRERQGLNWVQTGSWLKVLFSVLPKLSDTQEGGHLV